VNTSAQTDRAGIVVSWAQYLHRAVGDGNRAHVVALGPVGVGDRVEEMRLPRARHPGDNPQLAAGACRVRKRHPLIGREPLRRLSRDRADPIAGHPAVRVRKIVVRFTARAV
jgi:hypothetical protein